MKIISKILIVIVVAFVILLGARNILAKAVFEHVCRAATGLTLKIGSFSLPITQSVLEIKELKLLNPSSFSEKVMFDFPQIFINYDRMSIWKGNPHLREVKVHLALLSVEINKEGVLNLKSLAPDGSQKSQDVNKQAGSKPSKPMRVQIDTLTLRIDRVIFKDLSKAVPITQTLDMNIQETYRNVQDVRAVAPLLVSKVLTGSVIGRLANFSTGDLLKNLQASGVNLGDLNLDQIAGLGANAQVLLSQATGMINNAEVNDKAQKAIQGIEDLFGSLGKK